MGTKSKRRGDEKVNWEKVGAWRLQRVKKIAVW